MKIVIDTNIAVSGLLWNGASNNILKLARDGFIEICVTKTVCEELNRVLGYSKFQKRLEELCFTSDNRFIEAAIDPGSAIVISGDAHLLNIKEYKGIVIITAQEFLKLYKMLK